MPKKPNCKKVVTLKVGALLKCIDERRFAIPKLQREFVWDGRKAAKLLDSIRRHMPVGVVMVWETPRNQKLYLRQKYHVLPPFDYKNNKVWFLIDGQQRVSVLRHVREGTPDLQNALKKNIDFKRVVLALDSQESGQQILYRRPEPSAYESLSDILHPQWRNRLRHLGPQRLKRVEKCRSDVLTYPMHLLFMQAPIDDIRETFLRINTQGMKIGTAGAIFTQAEDLDLRDVLHEVQSHVDERFGTIPEMPILFAVAAIRGGKEARGEALKRAITELLRQTQANPKLKKILAAEWHRLSKCFGKAIDYMRLNFCVVSRDFLYSDYMVAVLALFFFWNRSGPSARQRREIQKWFWATAVGSRYSGNKFNTYLPADIQFFKKLASSSTARFSYIPQVEKIDVRKSLYAARTGISSAFYCMLMLRRPVSIMDSGLNEIPLDRYSAKGNRKDRHHIFPRAVLAGLGVPASLYNSICNICLLTAEENQRIGAKRPRIYLEESRAAGMYFAKRMKRHLIPLEEECGPWNRKPKIGFKEMVRMRNEEICDELETEAGIRLFRKDF